MSLHSLQQRAVDNLTDRNPNTLLDPSLFVLVAEMVAEILALLQDRCGQSPENATRLVRQPTRMQRRYVYRKLRREMGWRDFRTHGRDVYYSLVNTGKSVNVEEMREAYEEL